MKATYGLAIVAMAFLGTACAAGDAPDDEATGSVVQLGVLKLGCPASSGHPIEGIGYGDASASNNIGDTLYETCEEAIDKVRCQNADASALFDSASKTALDKCARDIKKTFQCEEPCEEQIDAAACKINNDNSDFQSREACQEVKLGEQVYYVGYCALSAWAQATGESVGQCVKAP